MENEKTLFTIEVKTTEAGSVQLERFAVLLNEIALRLNDITASLQAPTPAPAADLHPVGEVSPHQPAVEVVGPVMTAEPPYFDLAHVANPDITFEKIQQKALQIAAEAGGVKKEKCREIIKSYGVKVSDLKDQPDKWPEVWQRLTALESEG